MLAALDPECTMHESGHKLNRQTRPTYKGWGTRIAFLATFLIFLLFFDFAGRGWAQAPQVPSVPSVLVGPGSQFAIADFDGDHRPDLAYVETGQSGPGTRTYCVELHLTSKGRSCIRLSAPSGGLFVEARDVNGDHAVDLVVTTAWFRQPVAVLLNNGDGTFTAATPATFPGAFTRAQNNRLFVPQHVNGTVGLLTQSRLSIYRQTPLAHSVPEARPRWHSTGVIPFSSSCLSHRGRAPPIRS